MYTGKLTIFIEEDKKKVGMFLEYLGHKKYEKRETNNAIQCKDTTLVAGQIYLGLLNHLCKLIVYLPWFTSSLYTSYTHMNRF